MADEKNNMFAAIQQPAALCSEGNMAVNWREWKSSFDYFLIATGKDESTPKEKCALFMHIIGKFGREIYEELDLTEREKLDYRCLCEKFNNYCDPKRNINYERHIFFETYQKNNTFDKYLGILKINSKSCEFGSLKNSLILTQLIRGLRDTQMREKLLAKSSLNLEEAVLWCRAVEQASLQATVCGTATAVSGGSGGDATGSVEELWRAGASRPANGGGGSDQRGRWRGRARGARGFASQVSQPPQYRNFGNDPNSVCVKCDRNHKVNERCAAYNAKCYRCDRVGHFSRCCKARVVHEISDDCDEMVEFTMHNVSIDAASDCKISWLEKVNVNGVDIEFKLDTGADRTVMSNSSFKSSGFNPKILNKANITLREISKSKLPIVGYFNGTLKHKNNIFHQKIYVLDIDCNNLLGLDACINLKLVTKIEQLCVNNKVVCVNSNNEYIIDGTVFEGIGCLPNECKISVDERVMPVVSGTRKIPIKLRGRLKLELDEMERLNIICKEEGPTDWVSNIVIVEKPNKTLRICLDPRNLNLAVRRSHFQLPTLEEIASNLAGARYFSKCDANKGFWMVKLDEQSSKLCTFSTPFSRYRYLRLPYGINCAPEIFHKEMYNVFAMEGVEVYIDDLLIWGRTKEEHDRRLCEVIQRAVANGVKFNKDKCVFGVTELTFLGHTFNRDGMKPDGSRVNAILQMPTPGDRKELERFLGVTNYLSRFISNYAELSSPLRELLKKRNEFVWMDIHSQAYIKLKQEISRAPVLAYYNPQEAVTVSVDASSRGLGACLLQRGRPVAYAARTLTDTETRWAQIEKELLAVVFGCTRFHQYIYGHETVLVESDHKPLEQIIKKTLNETPARLQRLLLKIQCYPVVLKYKPGKFMYIPDTLSRAATEAGSDTETSDDVIVHVNALYSAVNATPQILTEMQHETGRDTTLQSLIGYYYRGWPNNKREITECVRTYWSVRYDLHVMNGILFRNNRVVVPEIMRNQMLKRLHEGHLGVDKCKRRGREVMWWPGMAGEIERCVLRCETCQRHRAANRREPLAPHPVPDRPWQVIATDIFEIRQKHYLLIVDYYSKFIEIAWLNNLQSSTIINQMKNIFCRFGIPEKVVSDNGTQYSSEEFKQFSGEWEFEHVTSSPLYPRSNGLAERNVQTVKRLMVKAHEEGADWRLALLNFRNTPLTDEDYSPAQLLMGRRLRTRLPLTEHLLQPELISPDVVTHRRSKNIQRSKLYYDRGTRALPTLATGERVRIRDGKVWVNARVDGPAHGNRSYWVSTDRGATYRRNRSHIMKTRQDRPVSTHADDILPATPNRDVQSPRSTPPAPPAPAREPDPGHGSHSRQLPETCTTRSGREVHMPLRYTHYVT